MGAVVGMSGHMHLAAHSIEVESRNLRGQPLKHANASIQAALFQGPCLPKRLPLHHLDFCKQLLYLQYHQKSYCRG